MAKLGRYSANRIKVQTPTADYSVTVADCGTLFVLGTAGVDLTLPTPADAGNGWWIEAVRSIDSGTANTIVTNGSANVMMGFAHTIQVDASTDATMNDAASLGDTITFTSAAPAGSYCRIVCDGTNFFVQCFASHETDDNVVTITQAS